MAQAPTNTFRAGLSLGFCPDLPLPAPPCRGSELRWHYDKKKRSYAFVPNGSLKAPWAVFQGVDDQVCRAGEAQEFAARVPGAQIVLLPKVGHGFSVARNWLPRLKETFSGLVQPVSANQPASLDDLPLVEVPGAGSDKQMLVVLVSGDGGWADIDQQLADGVSSRGVSVVGLNSLKYFWSARTPDGAARDLERISAFYLKRWHKTELVLVGYSLGADVLPFMVSRLPDRLRSKVKLLALLAPGRETAFEFHLSDWIGGSHPSDQYPLLPEIEKLGKMPVSCFIGQKEKNSLCRETLPSNVRVIELSGGHHFDGQYQVIVQDIMDAMK